MKQRRTYYSVCILPAIIILGVQILATMFLAEIKVFYSLYKYDGSKSFREYTDGLTNQMTSTNFLLASLIFYAVICILIFTIWYIHLQKADGKKISLFNITKGFKKGQWYGWAGVALFIVAMSYLSIYITAVVTTVYPAALEDYSKMASILSDENANMALLVLAAVVLGPICEELAFRGLTFRYARKSGGFISANLIQAFLFAAIHMNLVQGIYAFLMALFLGYIMEKTDNVKVCIIIHVLFNLIGSVLNELIYMPDQKYLFGLMVFAVLSALYGSYLLVKKSFDGEQEQGI